ncbi:MAG: crotonase/enoyl-CoA hydratase family protein [Actinobacteria bacterium]|nr:crotonase/enoyl-CoA hydratase family protein [Actinomycetota bacterium]
MSAPVSYELADGIATIRLDDGKVNALSLSTLGALRDALGQAEADEAVVVLTGREGILSAGFDLKTLTSRTAEAADMLRAGFELAERLLSFPSPVVIACTGHAVAMGSFLLLSGDYRVGASGPFRIAANEVAIGMTMPHTAVEICRHRLAATHLHRAVALAEDFGPDDAVAAGFLDRAVAPADVPATAQAAAARALTLDRTAHRATKRRVRGALLDAVKDAIERDHRSFLQLIG